MATKSEVLEKMNRRHGTDIGDYYMMLVWLNRKAGDCDRLAKRIPSVADQAAWYRADHDELMKAE
jgi:hypothetical protein